MNGLLTSHMALGGLLVLAALAAIFYVPARRIVLYLLVLQIVFGAVVWSVTKLVPPPAHWVLAIVNGGVYAASSAFEKRGRKPLALGFAVLGFVLFAYVFHLGQHALAASASP